MILSLLNGLVSLFIKCFFYPLRYKEEVYQYSEEFGLEKSLIFAVIKTESSFNRKALSSKGAKGLMQITDKTGEYISIKLNVEDYDLLDEEDNLRFGCYYISYLINSFKSQRTAIIAYNAGEGRVREWLKKGEYSKDGVEVDNIPYKETSEYVTKIYKRKEKYEKLYRKLLDK